MKPKVLFYCQHLLGIGHMTRSLALCQALLNDFSVDFIQGGPDIHKSISHADFKHNYLVPFLMDEATSQLYDPAKKLSSEEIFNQRKEQLKKIHTDTSYDIFITELFPFGRAKFKTEITEFIELLKTKNPQIKVFSSLRDILVQKKDSQKKDERMVQIVNQYYDGVLVHSDPHVIKLEDSFTYTEQIRSKIHYTGFICESNKADQILPKKNEIIVSMGGGVVGSELLLAVANCAEEIPQYKFRFYIGPYAPSDLKTQINQVAKISKIKNIVIEEFTNQFEDVLKTAALSISLAGYNTLMNTLNTQTMALMYPYMANQEQSLRGRQFEKTGTVKMITEADLSRDQLKLAILQSVHQFPKTFDIHIHGSRSTSSYLKKVCYEK